MKFLRRLLFFLILIAILLGVGAYYASFSEGERTGNLIKFSHKGIIFKTWEGTLDLGIFQGARPSTGRVENTIWEFSVPSDEIAAKIEAASKQGTRISLKYKEKFFKFPWVGDTKYWVTDVTAIPAFGNNQPGMQYQGQPQYQQPPQQQQYQQQPNEQPQQQQYQQSNQPASQGSQQL